MNIYSHYTKF